MLTHQNTASRHIRHLGNIILAAELQKSVIVEWKKTFGPSLPVQIPFETLDTVDKIKAHSEGKDPVNEIDDFINIYKKISPPYSASTSPYFS